MWSKLCIGVSGTASPTTTKRSTNRVTKLVDIADLKSKFLSDLGSDFGMFRDSGPMADFNNVISVWSYLPVYFGKRFEDMS
jgi:hypothetical protein